MKDKKHVNIALSNKMHLDDLKYFQDELGFNNSVIFKHCLHAYRLIHEKEKKKENINHD